MADLSGKHVAIIATDFFEEAELVRPRDGLRDQGAKVTVWSSATDPIQAVDGDTDKTGTKMTFKPDHEIFTNLEYDYDILVHSLEVLVENEAEIEIQA